MEIYKTAKSNYHITVTYELSESEFNNLTNKEYPLDILSVYFRKLFGDKAPFKLLVAIRNSIRS